MPGPLAAATISPVLGRSATSALAGRTAGELALGRQLEVGVEGELERVARLRLGPVELALGLVLAEPSGASASDPAP